MMTMRHVVSFSTSKKNLLFGMICFLFLSSSFATNYTSISNGSYNDCSIWDNGCPPNQIPFGDTVIINHDVDASSSMEIYGVLIVNASGDFSCDNDCDVYQTGRIDVNGIFLLTADLEMRGYLYNSGLSIIQYLFRAAPYELTTWIGVLIMIKLTILM